MGRNLIVVLILFFVFTGCTKQADTFFFTGQEGDWRIEIPKAFQKQKEEKSKDESIYVVSFRDENGKILSIGEMNNARFEVNEETLRKELEADYYLHIKRIETIHLNDGKVYGALVEDKATQQNMFYYKLKQNDKIITFMFYQKQPFTLEEEANMKSIVSTYKKM